MSGKQLVRRVITVFLGMLCFFLFLHAVEADAETIAVSHQPSALSHNTGLSAVSSELSAYKNPLR